MRSFGNEVNHKYVTCHDVFLLPRRVERYGGTGRGDETQDCRTGGKEMSDELELCPFCGGKLVIDIDDGGLAVLHGEITECIMGDLLDINMQVGSTLDDLTKKINTRPLEDALHAQLAEKDAEIDRLKNAKAFAERFSA
jgi:hypothetical protein